MHTHVHTGTFEKHTQIKILFKNALHLPCFIHVELIISSSSSFYCRIKKKKIQRRKTLFWNYNTSEVLSESEVKENNPSLSPVFSCRDSSEVKNICCSYIGPRFDLQHPHGGFMTIYNPVPGHLVHSSDFCEHQHAYCVHTNVQAKFTKSRINKFNE